MCRLTEEEGWSSTDEDSPDQEAAPRAAQIVDARYSCNDSPCSSEEDASSRIGELELAMARDLIRGALQRGQALDSMEELQFRYLRRPWPGRTKRGQSSDPLQTIPNEEQTREGERGISVPWSHRQTRHSGGEETSGSPT